MLISCAVSCSSRQACTCLLVSCNIYFTVSTASTAPAAATLAKPCSRSTKCTCRCPTVMAENMPAYLLRLSSSLLMSPVMKWNLACLHLSAMDASKASEWACSWETGCTCHSQGQEKSQSCDLCSLQKMHRGIRSVLTRCFTHDKSVWNALKDSDIVTSTRCKRGQRLQH